MATRVGGIEFSVRVETGDAEKALKRVRAALNKVIKETKASGTNFKALATGVAAAGAAFIGLGRAINSLGLVEKTKNATILAGRVEALGTVFQVVGKNAGFTAAQLNAVEDSVKRLGITTQAARQSLTQLLQANIDLRASAKLTRIAQDAAVIAGVDSSEAFNRLVVSIQRNDVRLLRNLGIVINLNTVYQKFASTTGRTINTLTAFEKRQLLLNEVIARGGDIAGSYEAALGDVFKRFTSLTRIVEEASREFGENFIPVFELAVDTTTDFLKAFTDGENSGAFQAFAATATVATVALGLMLTVMGTVAVAVGGLALAIITLGLPAVAVAAAAAAGAFVLMLPAILAVTAAITALTGSVFLVNKWAAALKEARVEGEALGQTQADLEETIRVINALAESGVRGASELRVLREEAERTAQAFPKLAVAIREAADAGDFTEVQRILQQAPIFLARGSEAVAKANEVQRASFRRAIKAVEELGFAREEAVSIVAESIRSGEGLNRVLEISAERWNDNLGPLVLTNDALTEVQFGFKDAGKEIRQAADEFQRAAGFVDAFNSSVDARELQGLQSALEETTRAGTQAVAALQQLQTAQRQGFSANETALAKFIDRQRKVTTEGVSSEQEILRARKLRLDAVDKDTEARINRRIQQIKLEVDAEEQKDAIEKLLQKSSLARNRKRVNIIKEAATAVEALAKQEEFFAANLEFENEQLRVSNEQLDIRAQRLDLLASGLEPALIDIQQKRAQQAQRAVEERKRLTIDLIDAIKRRNARRLELQTILNAALDQEQTKRADRALEQAEAEIKIISERRQLANRQNALDDRDFRIQIAQERKKQLDSRIADEEKALNEIAKIRGELNVNSLDQVRTFADQQKRALEDAQGFIRRTSARLGNQGLPGLKAIQREVDQFSSALGKAGTQAQIDAIAKLFPEALAQRIAAARAQLESAQKALDSFGEGRGDKERSQRIDRQKRFNELVDAGVPASVANAEREKQRVRDADELNTKEKALTAEVTKQEQAQRSLEERRKKEQAAFDQRVAEQRSIVEQQFNAQKRLLDLEAARTAELQKQVGVLQQQRQQILDITGGGQAMATGIQTVPLRPTPTAPIGMGDEGASVEIGSASQTAESLLKKLNAIENEKKKQDKILLKLDEFRGKQVEAESLRTIRFQAKLAQLERESRNSPLNNVTSR